jgi:hypothetical protein
MSDITMCKTRLWYSIPCFGLLAFCLLWGGAGIGNGVTASGSEALVAPETAEASLNAVLDDPEPYVSQQGKFRFLFPGKPEVFDQKAGDRVVHTLVHVDSMGTEYAVTYTDLEPATVRGKDPDLLLEGGLQGMAKAGGWTVSSKKAIKLGEYHGVDVTGEVKIPGAPGVGVGRTRMYIVGDRLYQSIIIGMKSKVSPDGFSKYIDSFELLPEAPAVARKNPARPAPGAVAAAKARQSRQQMAKRGSRPANSGASRPAPRNAKPAETETNAVTDDNPGPDPSKPAEVAIEVNSASSRLVELPKEGERRRARGEKFRETAPKGGLLVGVRVGYVKGSKVGSVQPIFQAGASYVKGTRHGAPVEGEITVVAKPGYAVGGVNTRAGLLLDAVQLVFMKYQDGHLDPNDSYASAWLGDPTGGNLKNVSGEGKIIAGFHGVTNQREVNSLGLVVAD